MAKTADWMEQLRQFLSKRKTSKGDIVKWRTLIYCPDEQEAELWPKPWGWYFSVRKGQIVKVDKGRRLLEFRDGTRLWVNEADIDLDKEKPHG